MAYAMQDSIVMGLLNISGNMTVVLLRLSRGPE